MDYNYIKELLDRYWNCETSLEEEEELRSFFTSEEEVPGYLQPDKELFLYQSMQKELKVSDDFDRQVISKLEPAPVKIKKRTLGSRLWPMFKGVAFIAIILTVGNVLEYTLTDKETDTYTDTYEDPAAAYKEVSTVLKMLSEEINKSPALKDSLLNREIEKPLER